MKNKVLLLFSFCLFIEFGFAQNRTCATMDMHYEQAEENQKYLEKQVLLEKATQNYMSNLTLNSSTPSLYTIPTVVHVLYNTSAENISDAQIYDQINTLNEDFRALNADVSLVPAAFQPLIGDAQITFCLASVDPNGNPTDGINRVATASSSFNSSGNPMKFSSSGGVDAWNTSEYLNVWVCNLGGGLLGYAQFPGGSSSTDGVVVNYTAFGSMGTAQAPYNKGRTLTHEIGHWLNLRHIWGDANCGDDFVNDTPTQQTSNYGCPSYPSASCGNGPNGDMFMNYMDYTNDACMMLFTPGQKSRMHSALLNSRASLLNSTACDATVVSGCTDPLANNYNPEATSNDGSCIYSCSDNVVSLNLQLDCWPEETSWSLSEANGNPIQSVNPGYYSNSSSLVETDFCLSNGCYDFVLEDTYGDGFSGGSYNSCGQDGFAIINDASGGVLTQTTEANFGSSVTLSFCINNQVLGCMDADANNYNAAATQDDGSCEYSCEYYGQTTIAVGGGSWASEITWTIIDCDGMEIASDAGEGVTCADLPQNYLINMFDSYGDGWNGNIMTIGNNAYTLEEGGEGSVTVGTCFVEVLGCMDADACNYDDGANTDNGSCTYATEGYDCEGNCLADADGDGVCDADEVAGCTDAAASNYNAAATDNDGACQYASISIDNISNGDEFTFGDVVAVNFSVLDFMVGVPNQTGIDGHIHYSLDGGSTVMKYNLFPIQLSDLASGLHTIDIWLVDNNHMMLNPMVSASVSFSVLEEELPVCETPSGLFTTDVVHSRVTFNWATTGANYYKIKVSTDGGATYQVITQIGQDDGNPAGNTKTRYMMEANTCYLWMVRGWCIDGQVSSWSDPVEFCTLPECPNATDHNAVDVEGEWATLTWATPSETYAGVSHYLARISDADANNWSFLGNIGDGTSKLKGALAQDASYDFETRTWCYTDSEGGTDPYYKSDWGGTGHFTTVSCPVQTFNLETSQVNATTQWFGAEFAVLDPAADHYLLRIREAGSEVWEYRAINEGHVAAGGRNVGLLSTGTEYEWGMRTYCSEGTTWKSPWTSGENFVAGSAARVEAPLASLDVYPNPSKDLFNVRFTSEEVQTIKVKVTSALGEVIYIEELVEFVGEYTKSVDFSKQSKGIYFLQLKTISGEVNKKIILN